MALFARVVGGAALDLGDVAGGVHRHALAARVCRADPAHPDRGVEILIDDPEAHMLCHPTNGAFRGTELFTSNLGRWHITRTEVGARGLPLP